jgi:hypothetical protein
MVAGMRSSPALSAEKPRISWRYSVFKKRNPVNAVKTSGVSRKI